MLNTFNVKKKAFKSNIYLLIILGISLFMAIAYASINSISLDIQGIGTAKSQDGIFIIDALMSNNKNADINNTKISAIYQSNLDSTIALSKSDGTSSVTYQITLYNSNNIDFYFYNVNYLLGTETYDNTDIIFKLDGLTYNTIIKSHDYLTFEITFSYKDNKVSSNTVLNSVLNFNFVEATSYEIQSIHGDYSLTTTCNAGSECKNMSVDNFILSVNEIIIPEAAYGHMTFTKTYNPSTGQFKLVREKLVGQNFITYSGIVNMISNPKLVASGQGTYSISLDLKEIEGYQNMTAEDFYYEIIWLDAPQEPYEENSELMGVSGTITFTKTYNSSTGMLTINRSSIKGTGVVTFFVNIYMAIIDY